MPGAPRVSIVVIGHSVRSELERCLISIERHAGVSTEVIFVDNASTDDTMRWIRAHHPQVAVVELPRNEFDTARNHGLARVRAPYTLFLDSDAALTEGALPAMVAALDDHAEWALVGPRLVYDDGSLQLSCRRFPPLLLPLYRRPPLGRFLEGSETVRRHLMADDDHARPRPVLYVIGACQLFRTSLAKRLGGLDERFRWAIADVDWCIRMWDAGGAVVYLPQATVVHSYRRLTSKKPLSRAAWRQLKSFAALQWEYRRRRGELIELANELDRRAAG